MTLSIRSKLVEARKEFQPFGRNKQAYNYKYADLDSIISATDPALIKYGLSVHTTSELIDIASKPWMVMTAVLSDETGQELKASIPMPLEKVSGAKVPAQDMGSIITYGRRYVYCALLNLTADEDIDGAPGETFIEHPQKPKPAPIAPSANIAKPVIQSSKSKKLASMKSFVDNYGKDAVLEILDISDSSLLKSWDDQKLQNGLDKLAAAFAEPF
jgi:hypothetical protein